MKITVDKPQIFESDTIETVDIDNATFQVNEFGHLLILRDSTKELIGYFPKDKWDCVYPRED